MVTQILARRSLSVLLLPMQMSTEPTQCRLSFPPDRRGGCFRGLVSELGCLTYIF